MARSLPKGSSVLLVTSIPFPIPYPLYFYPHSCHVLMRPMPGTKEALKDSLDPRVAGRVRRYFKELRTRGWLWDGAEGEGLPAKALEGVNFVLFFGFAGKVPVSKGLVQIGRFPWGGLFRVREGGR